MPNSVTHNEPTPRPSISSISDSTFRKSTDTIHDSSPMISSDDSSPTNKKPRGLFNRMLGRHDRSHQRSQTALSITPPVNATLLNNSPSSGKHLQAIHDDIVFSHTAGPKISYSRASSQLPSPASPEAPPLTINTLTASERAEKVRRNRKVLQIFGNDVPFITGEYATGDIAVDVAARHAAQAATIKPSPFLQPPLPLGRTPSLTKHLRRHSSPISPVFTKEAVMSPRVLRKAVTTAVSSVSPPVVDSSLRDEGDDDVILDIHGHPSPNSAATTLPEDDALLSTPTRPKLTSSQSFTSISTTSTTSTDDQTPRDTERARKRATIAKLHRFLGSRVPPELVLGYSVPSGEYDEDNPWEMVAPEMRPSNVQTKSRKSGINIAAMVDSVLRQDTYPVEYMSDGELDSRTSTTYSNMTQAQKARVVKKKLKIQKMLGECPPGALQQQFVPSNRSFDLQLPVAPGKSRQYMQHRYSLNSLEYLVKDNNHDHLQDLLKYMRADDENGTEGRVSHDSRPSPPTSTRRKSSISAPGAPDVVPPSPTESYLSFSTSVVSTPSPTTTEFQQRRRRAAKLSSFFGVEYRELFTEVLDTIESEVRHDRARGSLTAAEVQELLMKLRTLKAA